MANTINAITTGIGGLTTTADSSGDINLQSAGSTVVAVTSGGVAVTGTMTVGGNAVLNAGSTVTVAQGGTGRTSQTAFAVLCGGTTSTGAQQSIAGLGSSGQVLTSNGAGALPTFQTLAGFAAGTKLSFYQAAAPTGWTKDTTAALNDAVLRIVTGSGGVTGGSTAFTTWNGQTTSGATTLTTPQIPSHSHVVFASNSNPLQGAINAPGANFAKLSGSNSSDTGGSGSHDHPLTQNIKYADFIIATKD
jgi:hypothetical protein